jgi:hypothetical protein
VDHLLLPLVLGLAIALTLMIAYLMNDKDKR